MFKKFLLVMLLSFVLSAQYGIRAGVGLGTGSGDNIDGSISAGAAFGAYYNLDFSKTAGIQAELLFSSKAVGFTGQGASETSVFAANYIELNPLLVLDIPVFNLVFGPGVALNIGGADVEVSGVSVDIDDKYVKSMVFSLYYGIDFNITDNIGFQFKLYNNLSNLVEDDNSSFKSNGFMISLDYLF
jgi:hypothetical protein